MHCGQAAVRGTGRRAHGLCCTQQPATLVEQVRLGSSAVRQTVPSCLIRQGYFIANPPQVEHHRWTASHRSAQGHGLRPLDDSSLAQLRQLRWHAPPRHPRRVALSISVVVLLHLLFVLVLWHIMRQPPGALLTQSVEQSLQVRFVSRTASASVKPSPAPPALAKPPPAHRSAPVVKTREPVSRESMQLQTPATSPSSVGTAKLFDAHGQPLLPDGAASSITPDYVQYLPQGDGRVMQHSDPIKYKPTRFEEYFPPPDETAGGAAVRHAVDAVVGSKNVDLPRGVHLKCMTLLGIPIPNCINPPAPPSAKDGDERLNMAPAQPLDGAAQHPAATADNVCIAIYREGKPLPWGCPVDTPARAVDAELRARAPGAVTHP